LLALAGMLGFALQIASVIQAVSVPRSEISGANGEHEAGAVQSMIWASLWLTLTAACFCILEGWQTILLVDRPLDFRTHPWQLGARRPGPALYDPLKITAPHNGRHRDWKFARTVDRLENLFHRCFLIRGNL